MSDNSKIEWTDSTWNPVTGCSVVSPGCTHCYAMRLAGTRLKNHPSRAGLTREVNGNHVWTGEVRFNDEWLMQPLEWKRPRRIFVCAHGDLLHEAVQETWLDQVFGVARLAPQHQLQVLTKRSARLRAYMTDAATPERIAAQAGEIADRAADAGIFKARAAARAAGAKRAGTPKIEWPLPNVWIGVSAEDQKRADERIPDLLATPAAVRFVSLEPLLGPIDLTMIPTGCRYGDIEWCCDALSGPPDMQEGERLDWVITGGESGQDARPMHPDWERTIRDQCAAAGVPYFKKQWGEWAPICEMSEEAINACYHPAPKRDPEAARKSRVDQCVLHNDGERFDGRRMLDCGAFQQGKGAMTMFKIGKKAAGRLLDGREHNAMPEPTP